MQISQIIASQTHIAQIVHSQACVDNADTQRKYLRYL